jgi:pimeloyl-ACP methyl ester carboxylesterase
MTWTTLRPFKTDNGLAGYQGGSDSQAKPAIVLLHGVGLRAKAWAAVVKHLKNDCTLIALDLPGHGDSEKLGGNSPDLQDYADCITAYLETLGTPIYLAGHSMGAMIALDIATRSAALVQGVAALNAIYKRPRAAAKAVQMRAAALKNITQETLNTDVTLARWFGNPPSDETAQAAQSCKKWLHATPISQYQQAYEIFAHHDGPPADALAALKMPALFITGADEPNSTPEMSRTMAELAPHGEAIIISGAAHMMPMTHPRQVASALKQFTRG